jgi:hypothetical protein
VTVSTWIGSVKVDFDGGTGNRRAAAQLAAATGQPVAAVRRALARMRAELGGVAAGPGACPRPR